MERASPSVFRRPTRVAASGTVRDARAVRRPDRLKRLGARGFFRVRESGGRSARRASEICRDRDCCLLYGDEAMLVYPAVASHYA